ncbi:MAG TPA: vWA domain-containing protein, partial [Bryobacteraceae bacterium]|nr:vWA domain-containing protein [Bryobacteraceae bacterium]
MFEFLFKYPLSIYRQGTFIFLAGWPLWLMGLGVLAAAGVLGFLIWRQASGTARMGVFRRVSVWVLQTALAALLLFLLWHPALSVSTLKPQQNIVAVVIDDSTSMTTDNRKDQAVKILDGGLLKALQAKFQVRLYRLSDHAERIDKLEQLTASSTATHIGESLKQVAADASSLPIGAMILLSDGADNTGGVDLETLSEIRRQRIPVHTIGLGQETMSHDVEISNVDVSARALPESRLAATVSFHQHGYTGQKAKITLREGSKVVANQEVTLKAEGTEQVESVLFNAGDAGVKTLEASIDPFPNEENPRNNRVTRLVNVDPRKPRILYMEGEPRWEFKFLKRAVEDDKTLDVATILRTAPNKLYRQGVCRPGDTAHPQVGGKCPEMEDGFPSKVEELFAFDGLIFGSVDAPYLTKNQQDLVKQFVDRRGGGVLFTGGRDSLSDGGWAKSAAADIFPTTLPERKNTYSFAGADVELTPEGRDSLITRIEEDPNK